jgi:hypothetical protein
VGLTGRAESVVVSVAVRLANPVELCAPLCPEYVTVPLIGVEPLRNCTVPVGAAPLLRVPTVAVSVTCVVPVMAEGLGTTRVTVVALVTVSASATGPLAL